MAMLAGVLAFAGCKNNKDNYNYNSCNKIIAVFVPHSHFSVKFNFAFCFVTCIPRHNKIAPFFIFCYELNLIIQFFKNNC